MNDHSGFFPHITLGGSRGGSWAPRFFPTTTTNPNPVVPDAAASQRRMRDRVRAKFLGGPRHGQTFELGAEETQPVLTLPSPEGTHAYERSSVDWVEMTAVYKYIGILNGSDAPDEVEMQLVSALATVADHVKRTTALTPGSIMLPESVFPEATKVLGLEIVRGDRVALLLELL